MDRDVEYYYPPRVHDYGSNSFKFYNGKVTGGEVPPGSDAIDFVDAEIVTNIDKPFTKLVDLDVDCQMHSTLYGMQFGIRKDGELLLYGDWTPCVIANHLWPQLTCFNDTENCLLNYSVGGESFSAQSATTLTNIKWANETVYNSPLLRALKIGASSHNNTLAIRITQHAFKMVG
jgi:hypothetical protein